MDAVTACRQLLEALYRRAKEQHEAVAALGDVLLREAESLRRHDQARRLHSLMSEVMREVEDIRRGERNAARAFHKVTFWVGTVGFAIGTIGAAVAGSHEHPLSVGARLAKVCFERTQPFGTVLVAVGPGGVPDDVHVAPVSRWARESDRGEAEVEAVLKAKGYSAMTPETFSRVTEELEDRVLRGILALPVAPTRLLPKEVDGGSE